MLSHFTTGAAFGAALASAGVHKPAVVLGQMTMRDWSMLEMFLTASGTSALLITLLRHLGDYLPGSSPRGLSSLHLLPPSSVLSSVDANIIGGLLQGLGMALSGACAGTVFAQVGDSCPSGLPTLAGGALGGLAWAGFLRGWVAERRRRTAATKQAQEEKEEEESSKGEKKKKKNRLALDEYLPNFLGKWGTVILLDMAFAGIVAGVVAYTTTTSSSPPSPTTTTIKQNLLLSSQQRNDAGSSSPGGPLHPILSGLLVAAAQGLSVVTRSATLGTSTTFEEMGDLMVLVAAVSREKEKTQKEKTQKKTISYNSIILTAGMIAGSYAVSTFYPSPSPSLEIGTLRAVAGGFCLAVGARLAGGCTSGHGISGISLLSVSSFVSVAAMFAGGMGFAAVFPPAW